MTNPSPQTKPDPFAYMNHLCAQIDRRWVEFDATCKRIAESLLEEKKLPEFLSTTELELLNLAIVCSQLAGQLRKLERDELAKQSQDDPATKLVDASDLKRQQAKALADGRKWLSNIEGMLAEQRGRLDDLKEIFDLEEKGVPIEPTEICSKENLTVIKLAVLECHVRRSIATLEEIGDQIA